MDASVDLLKLAMDETWNHVNRVAKYSHIIAKRIRLPVNEVRQIYVAAPLHDVGKIEVPTEILLKQGKLTEEEMEVMKGHCQAGYDLLFKEGNPVLEMAARIALEHHERFDGKGYPRGLKGNKISIYGRIVSVADVFDALTSERVYKKAWSKDEAFVYIMKENGKSFDPRVVEGLLENRL